MYILRRPILISHASPHYSFRENDTTAGYTIYRGGVIFAETVPFHLGGVDLTSLSKKGPKFSGNLRHLGCVEKIPGEIT